MSSPRTVRMIWIARSLARPNVRPMKTIARSATWGIQWYAASQPASECRAGRSPREARWRQAERGEGRSRVPRRRDDAARARGPRRAVRGSGTPGADNRGHVARCRGAGSPWRCRRPGRPGSPRTRVTPHRWERRRRGDGRGRHRVMVMVRLLDRGGLLDEPHDALQL